MVRQPPRGAGGADPGKLRDDPAIYTAAVALCLGHWPFSTPLLEMDETDDDWAVAVLVIEQAHKLRWPEEA